MKTFYVEDDGLLWPIKKHKHNGLWKSEYAEAPFILVNYIQTNTLMLKPCEGCGETKYDAAIIWEEDDSLECLSCAIVNDDKVAMEHTIDFHVAASEEQGHEEGE